MVTSSFFRNITFYLNSKKKYSDTQKCLNLCGLVEFAKYKANKEDFDEIVKLAEDVIKQLSNQ